MCLTLLNAPPVKTFNYIQQQEARSWNPIMKTRLEVWIRATRMSQEPILQYQVDTDISENLTVLVFCGTEGTETTSAAQRDFSSIDKLSSS